MMGRLMNKAVLPAMWLSLLAVAGGAAPAEAQVAQPGPAIELTPCHVKGVESLAQCGALAVPENHADPDGKTINLNIAVLPPSGGQPTKAPLYFLAGGPGQAATELGFIYERLLRQARRGRETVLIDQRGTGGSNGFDCSFPNDPTASGADAARACVQSLTQDTEHYLTEDFVTDLEAVRAAFGHDKIALMGVSYGTRAGLRYADRYEDRVEAMVLDSLAPPQTQIFSDEAAFAGEALRNTIIACQDDAACAEAFPDLSETFQRVLAQLEAEPQRLAVLEADGVEIDVDRDLFLMGFRGALYSPPSARTIPFIVDAAGRGNFRPWLALTDFGNQEVSGTINIGLNLSVQCAEEVPLVDEGKIAKAYLGFPNSYALFWKEACAVWPAGTPTTGFNDPVEVDVPTLLMSGRLDPITPPALGDIAAAGLSNSVHLIAENAGHSVFTFGCAARLVAEFLNDPDPAALDASCLNDNEGADFIVGRFGIKP